MLHAKSSKNTPFHADFCWNVVPTLFWYIGNPSRFSSWRPCIFYYHLIVRKLVSILLMFQLFSDIRSGHNVAILVNELPNVYKCPYGLQKVSLTIKQFCTLWQTTSQTNWNHQSCSWWSWLSWKHVMLVYLKKQLEDITYQPLATTHAVTPH